MRVLCVVLLLMAAPAAAQSRLSTALYFSGASADILTTALPSQRCVEKNPLWTWQADHRGLYVASTSALMMGNWYLWHRMGRRHPKLSTWMLIGTGAVEGGVALQNARVCW
jgi:protocatechuate 3,4-dioxygenase beta subunit